MLTLQNHFKEEPKIFTNMTRSNPQQIFPQEFHLVELPSLTTNLLPTHSQVFGGTPSKMTRRSVAHRELALFSLNFEPDMHWILVHFRCR